MKNRKQWVFGGRQVELRKWRLVSIVGVKCRKNVSIQTLSSWTPHLFKAGHDPRRTLGQWGPGGLVRCGLPLVARLLLRVQWASSFPAAPSSSPLAEPDSLPLPPCLKTFLPSPFHPSKGCGLAEDQPPPCRKLLRWGWGGLARLGWAKPHLCHILGPPTQAGLHFSQWDQVTPHTKARSTNASSRLWQSLWMSTGCKTLCQTVGLWALAWAYPFCASLLTFWYEVDSFFRWISLYWSLICSGIPTSLLEGGCFKYGFSRFSVGQSTDPYMHTVNGQCRGGNRVRIVLGEWLLPQKHLAWMWCPGDSRRRDLRCWERGSCYEAVSSFHSSTHCILFHFAFWDWEVDLREEEALETAAFLIGTGFYLFWLGFFFF